MNDEISDEERHLIDEAIAAGKVRKMPPGVRSITLGDFIYNERLGRLVNKSKEDAKRRLRNGIKWGRGKWT